MAVKMMSTRLPAARRRRQLLDVALATFAERGFHATSMNDIAETAGVTKPVLYQHFGSKRELYRELLEDVGNQLRQIISAATAGASSPHGQVASGFRAYFHFVANHPGAFRLLFGAGTRFDEEFAETVRRVEMSLAETIAELIEVPGLTADRRLLLAHGIVGLAEGTGRLWLADGLEGEPDDLAAQVADLAWAGLRGINGQ